MNKEPKPLERFDFLLVQEPLDGLLRNMDSDLQRRLKEIGTASNFEEYRQITLLFIMLRIAANSYQALGFLLSDIDVHHKRLPRFVLVVPPVTRQIMDLWFTLVYMMDDFGPRSLLYEQYAYRQLTEQIAYAQKRYQTDPEWEDWFEDTQKLLDAMEPLIPITVEQKADPKTIASWPHPHALSEKPSTSQDFLKFLHELLYGDISMETHFLRGHPNPAM